MGHTDQPMFRGSSGRQAKPAPTSVANVKIVVSVDRVDLWMTDDFWSARLYQVQDTSIFFLSSQDLQYAR